MRYAMKARIIPGKAAALKAALEDGSFSRGFPYGDLGEALKSSRVDERGDARWVEVCYCREYYDVAMKEELPYLERFLHEIEVGDARDPRFCDGYPKCNDCNCTDSVTFPGIGFNDYLEKRVSEEIKTSPAAVTALVPTRFRGWQGKVQTEQEQARNACKSASASL
jgi:hypothetical protein